MSNEADASSREEAPSWRLRLRNALPSQPIVMIALLSGLCLAWWMSFHELACGGVSMRIQTRTITGCYSFTLGTATGALLTLLLHRAGKARLGAFRSDNVLGIAWYGIMVAATVLFYAAVGLDAYQSAAFVQVLINVVCGMLAARFAAMLSLLTLSDAAFILLVDVSVFALVDDALLPGLVAITGSFFSCIIGIALIATLIPALAKALIKHPHYPKVKTRLQGACEPFASPKERKAEPAPSRAKPPLRLPWQLFFHVAVYGILLGILHVESSSVIEYAYARASPYFVGTAMAAFIFWWCFVRSSASSAVWQKVRNVVFPLTAACFLVLSLLSSAHAAWSFLPLALVSCATPFFYLMLVLGIHYVSRSMHRDVFSVAPVGIAVFELSFFVGVVISRACYLEVLPDFIRTPQATLAAFVLLVAATLWLGNDAKAHRLWGHLEETPAQVNHNYALQSKCDAFARIHRLTPKQREITLMLIEGKRPAQIADLQVLSLSTVRTHIRNIYAAADVHSHAELTREVEAMDPDAYGWQGSIREEDEGRRTNPGLTISGAGSERDKMVP